MAKKNVPKKKRAAKTKQKLSKHDPIEGAEMLRRVFPMLAVLAKSGTQ